MFWNHGDFVTLSNLASRSSNSGASTSSSSASSAAAGGGGGIAESGLTAIKAFVMTNNTCRRKLLLNYFAEKMVAACSGCDNCDRAAAAAAAASASPEAAAATLHDFTADCRTMLQALEFCGANCGFSKAILVVQGSTAKALESIPPARLQTCPAYGAGAGRPPQYWQVKGKSVCVRMRI